MTWLDILFYLLLADALIANVIAYTSYQDMLNKIYIVRRYLPITKG